MTIFSRQRILNGHSTYAALQTSVELTTRQAHTKNAMAALPFSGTRSLTTLFAALAPRRKSRNSLSKAVTMAGVVAVMAGATVGALKGPPWLNHTLGVRCPPRAPSPHPSLTLAPNCSLKAGSPPSAKFAASDLAWLRNNIKNVVFVMQENHSADEYLSQLPGFDGAPNNATQPGPHNTAVTRTREFSVTPPDISHDWNTVHKEYNNGTMDGFALAAAQDGINASTVMGYYTRDELPFLYTLASKYATSDRYFASIMAGTTPNRAMVYLASSYGVVFNEQVVPANATSIFDALTAKNVSWAIYSTSTIDFVLDQALANDAPHNFTDKYANRVKDIQQYYKDAASGALPAFSIVEPSHGANPDTNATALQQTQADEHPPTNITLGQYYVQTYFDALQASPQWNKSVFLLTYDEGGAFYDHVPPQPACEPDAIQPMLGAGDEPGAFNQTGMRVPFVAAGPMVRRGYISHVVQEHTAIARFLGALFDFPALTRRDANSPALLDMFALP